MDARRDEVPQLVAEAVEMEAVTPSAPLCMVV